jgi:hypothetical protein
VGLEEGSIIADAVKAVGDEAETLRRPKTQFSSRTFALLSQHADRGV